MGEIDLDRMDARPARCQQGAAGLAEIEVLDPAVDFVCAADHRSGPLQVCFLATDFGAPDGPFWASILRRTRERSLIVDVEPTAAIRQAEVTAVKQMIERTRERFVALDRMSLFILVPGVDDSKAAYETAG